MGIRDNLLERWRSMTSNDNALAFLWLQDERSRVIRRQHMRVSKRARSPRCSDHAVTLPMGQKRPYLSSARALSLLLRCAASKSASNSGPVRRHAILMAAGQKKCQWLLAFEARMTSSQPCLQTRCQHAESAGDRLFAGAKTLQTRFRQATARTSPRGVAIKRGGFCWLAAPVGADPCKTAGNGLSGSFAPVALQGSQLLCLPLQCQLTRRGRA